MKGLTSILKLVLCNAMQFKYDNLCVSIYIINNKFHIILLYVDDNCIIWFLIIFENT
jgi:hypothetical protein